MNRIFKLKHYEWNGKDYDINVLLKSNNLEECMDMGFKLLIEGESSIRIHDYVVLENGESEEVKTYDDLDINDYNLN